MPDMVVAADVRRLGLCCLAAQTALLRTNTSKTTCFFVLQQQHPELLIAAQNPKSAGVPAQSKRQNKVNDTVAQLC